MRNTVTKKSSVHTLTRVLTRILKIGVTRAEVDGTPSQIPAFDL